MQKNIMYRFCRFGLGVLGLAAIVTDVVHGFANVEGFSLFNYLSFFTVESTTFASVLLIWLALTGRDYPNLRGAATLFMVITGVIYFFTLRDLPIEIFWVNAVFHYVLPAALLLDWLFNLPKSVPVKKTVLWLVFPLAFFVYSLVRGAFIGWYPYPFLDVIESSYGAVLTNALVLGIGMALMALAVGNLPRLRSLFDSNR